MTVTVAVADDQALVRVGFCGIVAATPGLAVVGEAANGAEAVAVARTAKPDVLLMDVRMPVLDGIEATQEITSAAESAGVRVIILTTFDLDEYVFGALRAGASGFLLKDTLPEDLITAIRVVAAGEALLAPSVTRRLISEFARTPALGMQGPAVPGLPTSTAGAGTLPGAVPAAARADKVTGLLTDRECEVLRLVAAGMSNGEIADHLRISPATAKTHVAHLLTKLDARDRVQLVIIAYQAGLATATTQLCSRHRHRAPRPCAPAGHEDYPVHALIRFLGAVARPALRDLDVQGLVGHLHRRRGGQAPLPGRGPRGDRGQPRRVDAGRGDPPGRTWLRPSRWTEPPPRRPSATGRSGATL